MRFPSAGIIALALALPLTVSLCSGSAAQSSPITAQPSTAQPSPITAQSSPITAQPSPSPSTAQRGAITAQPRPTAVQPTPAAAQATPRNPPVPDFTAAPRPTPEASAIPTPEPTPIAPNSSTVPEPAGSQQPLTPPQSSPSPLAAAPSAAPLPGFGGAPGARLGRTFDGYFAVAYALQHAPTLLAQRATITSDDATYTRDRAIEFPTLGGSVQNQIQKSSNVSGAFAQFGIAPVSNFSQNTAQLQSTYNLFNGGQQLVAQQAKRTTQAAKFELRRLEEQTAIAVSNAFYNLAALQEVVLLDSNDVRYQQALLDASLASERVGRVAGVDVLRAQVALGRSSAILVQARVDERNAGEALAVQIGAPIGSTFALPKIVPEPPKPTTSTAELGTIAKLNRPEILEAKATFDASKLGDAAVDNDLRPTVQLGGSFGSQVSPTSLVQQQQAIDAQNASALAGYNVEKALFPNIPFAPPVPIPPVDRQRPGFWQFNVTSTFAAPLYDYGQRAALHHAARAQIDAALASLYNAYDAVQADVDAARRNLDSSATKLGIAKDSARLGRETARIAQLQYKNGLVSFTDATQTEQTALSAENDLVAARVTYVTALIRLRVALAPSDTAAAADLRGL